jgi:hypothetical protein
MNSIEITAAIRHLVPNAEFSFTDNDLSTLKWDSTELSKPTITQIKAAIPIVKAAQEAEIAAKAATKAALLERLGITADEAALLLS